MMSVREVFAFQGRACEELGSPFMGRLNRLHAQRLEATDAVAAKVLNWQGDPSTSADSVPLRLAGGYHALALRGDAALRAVYPPNAASDEALWKAWAEARRTHEAFLLEWLESPPQTNEVRRSGPLIAAAQVVAARFGLPLALYELGASAGLNLNFPRFSLNIGDHTFGAQASPVTLSPDWDGPLPPQSAMSAVTAKGVDLRAIDATSVAGQLRLLAYLWPDQPERLERTRAALAMGVPAVDQGDGIAWLKRNLALQAGQAAFVYSTVAYQYFPQEAQDEGAAFLDDLGRKATAEAPLAWFRMEADGEGAGAGLRLKLWPSGEDYLLGRADFHGRWVRWQGLTETLS